MSFKSVLGSSPSLPALTGGSASSTSNITDTNIENTGGIGRAASAYKVASSSAAFNNTRISPTEQASQTVASSSGANRITQNQIFNAERGIVRPGSSSGTSKINIVGEATAIDSEISSKISASNSTKIFTLPKDVSSQYCMKLQFYTYDRNVRTAEAKASPTHIMILPLPLNLVDTLGLQYNNIALGPLLGEFYQQALSAVDVFEKSGTAAAAADIYKGIKNALTQEGSQISRIIARRIISRMSQEAGAAVDLALGNTPNPHQTVTFNGVDLRSFQFNWRISPNSEAESAELRRFITTMKEITLPKKNGQFLLNYPNALKIKLMPTVLNDLFGFNKRANLVVNQFQANYAPSGSLSFHRDDMPSDVEISMSIRETDIQLGDDYMTQGQESYVSAEASQARTTEFG